MAILEVGQLTPKLASISVDINTPSDPQAGLGEATETGTSPFLQGPIDEYRNTFGLTYRSDTTGTVLPTYANLWFDTIHVLPASVDVGNVLSEVVGSFLIKNTYLNQTKTLIDTIPAGAAGITLTPPGPNPLAFVGGEEKTFDYEISVAGPSIIEALYAFNFGAEGFRTFRLNGTRSVLFPFPAQRPVVERLQFLTSVMSAYDGNEQRFMTRVQPRQEFEMEYLLYDEQQVASAMNLLQAHSARFFGVVLWQYSRPLLADLAVSDSVISVDTEFSEFRVGDQGILWSGWDDTEIFTITSMTSNSIITEQPLGVAHDALNTTVLPLQFCLAGDRPKTSRTQNNVTTIRARWRSIDTDDYADVTALPTYKSKPLLTDPNFIRRDLDDSFVGDFSVIDYNTGLFEPVRRKLLAQPTSEKTWAPETSEELFAIRQFLYWTRGKLRSWWMPSFRADFQAVDQIDGGDTIITVKGVEYARLLGRDLPPMQDIYIELHDGTTFQREIVSANVAGNGVDEELEIDSPLGVQVFPEDIKAISYLMLLRINSDKLTITHSGQGRAGITVPTIGVFA